VPSNYTNNWDRSEIVYDELKIKGIKGPGGNEFILDPSEERKNPQSIVGKYIRKNPIIDNHNGHCWIEIKELKD